jgi:uncharacterized protein (DUF2252 family)
MSTEKESYKSPNDRQPALLAQQKLKMARSAHAYVRGNTLQFYKWLRAGSEHSIPTGPLCGSAGTATSAI